MIDCPSGGAVKDAYELMSIIEKRSKVEIAPIFVTRCAELRSLMSISKPQQLRQSPG